LESILKHYEDCIFEISYTKKGEIVLIFFSKQDKGAIKKTYYLCGLNGEHNIDSKILLNRYEKLKIVDIGSYTQRRGYARALLEFTIQKAKKNQIEIIHGDLSSVDSYEFDWLIPFYESLGFECELYVNNKSVMDGKIEMALKRVE